MPWICTSPLGKRLQIMPNLKSLDLGNCDAVPDLCRFPNLEELKIRDSKKVEKFEIVTEMKALKRLDLSGTAIKEFPSLAIGYLINLERLTLVGCKKLEHVSCNIFMLQHLQLLDFSRCEKLVTFPRKSWFSNEESTSLQAKHYAPLFVNLSSCSNLVEITCIPREIYGLNTNHCFRLERISKLSNILEGKESMIRRMELRACIALYRNLARQVSKMKKNYQDNSELTALFSLFFSCRQSEHQVMFSAIDFFQQLKSTCGLPGIRIPDWYTCRMDIDKKGLQVCNFRIDFPYNFRWNDDRGLAFCALSVDLNAVLMSAYFRVLTIYINGVSIIEASENPEASKWGLDGFVWFSYMSRDAIIKRLSESGLPPPSRCLVEFKFEPEIMEEFGGIGSCGVHVIG